MCFSLRASVAAAATGVASAILVLYFLVTRVEDAFVGRSAALLPTMLITAAVVQVCDAVAHAQAGTSNASRAPSSSWRAALVCWLAIMAQPIVFSAAAAVLLGGGWTVVLWANVCIAVVGITLNLVLDLPVSDWLVLEVVPRENGLANVVHGSWTYGNKNGALLSGPTNRVSLYFTNLVVGFVALVVLATRVDDAREREPYAEIVAIYMLGLGSSLAALLLVSELFVNVVSGVRNHVSSVWCALSLTATLAFGTYLTAAHESDRPFALLYVGATLGIYALAYNLTPLPASSLSRA